MAMASPVLTTLGLLFVTVNSVVAVRRSWGDAAATIFFAASYAGLLLLFHCLRAFEASPPGSAARGRAKVGVWLSTTLLTAMFTFRVSALMPSWPVSAVVCLMGGSTTVIGGYALFPLPGAGY